MNTIKNIFAAIGLILIVSIALLYVSVFSYLSRFGEFDEHSWETYKSVFEKIIESGNASEATVWKVKVEEGLSFEDVETSLRMVANEHNIKNVGELPIYKQVEAMTGEKYRTSKIYMFCDALTAARMLDYNDAYSAYLPCRVSLIEDKTGALWIYTLNMDLMIHGGVSLPRDLKEEALRIKAIILDIMNRGAIGDF